MESITCPPTRSWIVVAVGLPLFCWRNTKSYNHMTQTGCKNAHSRVEKNPVHRHCVPIWVTVESFQRKAHGHLTLSCVQPFSRSVLSQTEVRVFVPPYLSNDNILSKKNGYQWASISFSRWSDGFVGLCFLWRSRPPSWSFSPRYVDNQFAYTSHAPFFSCKSYYLSSVLMPSTDTTMNERQLY